VRKLSMRSTAIVVTTVADLAIAGSAWAAWNLTGSGSARAKAGQVENLTVTDAAIPAGGLAPGHAATVLLTVENRNTFPVRIVAVQLTRLRSSQSGCDATANVHVVNTAPLPADAVAVTVPAGSAGSPASATITWDGPLKMKADPADACQGAPFTFNVHLDAVSAA
jgi:hypothetical protein